MVCPSTRMGEGFVSNKHPSPIIARGSIELPSPAAEVGFIRLRPNLKVPELGQARVRVGEGAITTTALVGPAALVIASHPSQTASIVPAARFCARGLQLCFAHPNRGVGGAPRDVRVLGGTPVGRAVSRHVRRLRGALRPMTRDARLSALHRGGFSPGAALLSPAFAPDRLQRAPRSQVVVPGGRRPGPPGASGYELPPRDATPRSAFRIVSRTRPRTRPQ